MKRIVLLLSIILVLGLCLAACAEKEPAWDDLFIDQDIAQIIHSQLSEDDQNILKNSGGFEVPNAPILKIYDEIFWALAGESLETILTKAEADCQAKTWREYYVFSDEPYLIRTFQNQIWKPDNEKVPQYVKDIYGLSKYITVNGKESELKGIYCFDILSSYLGAAVYLQTDTGVLVKYYETSRSEAQVFFEDEFQAYGTEYFEYITSYELNHDENGSPLGGVHVPLAEYLNGRPLSEITIINK